jgi:Guanine nucleotide exchange factor synembryn
MTPPFGTAKASPKADTGALTGQAKLNDVTRLLTSLQEDLKSKKLRPEQRKEALEKLKIYGRDPKDAAPIFTKEAIETLTKHGLEGDAEVSSLEALRCLANAMLLEPKTRQIFVDLGYCGQAAERLKNQDSDNEFLICRILFLTTYDSNLDFDPLFDGNSLGESINSHVARHSKQFTKGSKRNATDPFDSAALSEALKLLFNISNYYPHRIATFTPCIENIFKILSKITIPHPPLQPPINYLINALVNLDLEDRQAAHLSANPIFPKFNSNTNVDKLINILDQSVSVYKPVQLESLAVPLLTVLRKIYEFAPEGPKRYMQWLLLPEEDDRDLPLGQSDTLSSRLLRLSTSPAAPNLREGISSLLFELSGKDADRFVRNVGYGFAAGFLLSHDIPVPASARGAHTAGKQRSGARDTGGDAEGEGEGEGEEGEEEEEEEEEGELVNPITGQKLSKEGKSDDSARPEMSDEEKEREAERLFVLFERLRATGVVDVKNPVREAVESGRFEQDNHGGGKASGKVEEVSTDDDDDDHDDN